MEEEQVFTESEKMLMELEWNLIEEFMSIRKHQHITQEELAKESQVIRQTIHRIEHHMVSPQLKNILKLLQPLGYTLKIVRLDEKGE